MECEVIDYEYYDDQDNNRLRYIMSVHESAKAEFIWNSDGTLNKLVGWKIGQTNPKEIQFQWDNYGRLEKITFPSPVGTSKYIEWDYDLRWRVSEVSYSGKQHIHYTYNQYDELVKIETSGFDENVFRTETYQYNDAGQLSSYQITDTQNNINEMSNYSYTDLGWLEEITNNQDDVATFLYNRYGDLIKLENEDTYSLYYEYDNNGNITEIKHNENDTDFIVHTEYDGEQILTREYEDGNLIVPEYDDYGRMTKVTDQNGKSLEVKYSTEDDEFFRAIAIIDQDNKRTDLQYDDYGRITAIEDHVTGNILFETNYDDDNNKVTYRDADGNTQVVERDNNGYIKSITDANNNTWTYIRDEFGNVISKIDGAGHTTTYEWDGSFPRKVYLPEQYDYPIEKTYNEKGLLESYIDADGNTLTYEYDTFENYVNLVTRSDQSEVQTNSGTSFVINDDLGEYNITTTSIDGNDFINSISLPTSWQTSYTYIDKKLSSFTNNIGTYSFGYDEYTLNSYNPPELNNSMSFSYDDRGRADTFTVTTNTDKILCYDHAYNSDGLMSEININHDSSLLLDMDYTYNDIGELTNLSIYDGLNTTTKSCQYDAMSQLTSTTSSGVTNNYTYDDVYNLTSISDGTITKSFSYNARDQLINFNDGTDSWTLSYNKSGELISKLNDNTNDEWAYSYNDYGQMVSAILPDDTEIEIEYYAMGSRAKK